MSEQIKNKLWNLVDNSNVYSFEDNPLPIFRELAIHYMRFSWSLSGVNIYDEINGFINEYFQGSKEWREFIWNLIKEVLHDFKHEKIQNILSAFSDILRNEVDKELLIEITDFFAEKYIALRNNKCIIPSLSEDLVDFIYWYAVENTDAWVDGLAIYNPYAGISPFGKKHIEEIKSQIEMYSVDSSYNPEECKSYIEDYRKLPWYYGVESDKTLRLINNVCLLVRTPENFEQMFIHSGEAVDDDISGFTGNWTFLAVPPLESYAEASESDVKLISTLVDKFIDAKGMYDGFFLLPKIFCYDESYEWIRRKMVCSGNLSAVIELPQLAFNSPCDAVLVCLCKSTYDCGTKMLNGVDYMNNMEWDYPELRDSCVNSLHPNKGKIIGDYTLSQCNYCLLPSMYLYSEKEIFTNEDLKACYRNYKTFIESQNESEKKRIAHRDISGHLSHMLGTTYHKIFDAISELKYVEGLESTYSMLNDNFEYMRRLINSIDDDFSSQSMKLEETAINDFMQKYCSAWKNYGKKQFAVSFESDLNDDTTFKIDEIFMKVMLDAILENANRHGFDGVDIENPQIRIHTSYVMINNMPCVLISIANNGASFPNDFTIEQYIREGEFGGTKGRTGRGGYHVYQIAKRHQGYINISNDDEWNVKINIMIPIEYYDECETEKIMKYGEEFM